MSRAFRDRLSPLLRRASSAAVVGRRSATVVRGSRRQATAPSRTTTATARNARLGAHRGGERRDGEVAEDPAERHGQRHRRHRGRPVRGVDAGVQDGAEQRPGRAVGEVVDGEPGAATTRTSGPASTAIAAGAAAEQQRAGRPGSSRASSRRSAGTAIAPDGGDAERDGEDRPVHRGAVVRDRPPGRRSAPVRAARRPTSPTPPTAVSSRTSRIGPSVTDSRTAPVTVAGIARAPAASARARRCPRAAAGPRSAGARPRRRRRGRGRRRAR